MLVLQKSNLESMLLETDSSCSAATSEHHAWKGGPFQERRHHFSLQSSKQCTIISKFKGSSLNELQEYILWTEVLYKEIIYYHAEKSYFIIMYR